MLQERIEDLFAETTHVRPASDADVFESGLLDSLAFVGLLARLEQEFGICISLEDIEIENFRCVAKIADFVGKRQAGLACQELRRA